MEIMDIYDLNRRPTGRTFVRGEKPQDGYYLVVQVLVFNKAGELLIQQRQPTKPAWPNKWDISAGGSVQAGETSQQAASRELQEELGLSIDFTGVRPHVCSTFAEGFTDVYTVEREVDPSALTLQAEEVQAARWATQEDVQALIAAGDFVPYYPSWIAYLFETHRQYGSFRREEPRIARKKAENTGKLRRLAQAADAYRAAFSLFI